MILIAGVGAGLCLGLAAYLYLQARQARGISRRILRKAKRSDVLLRRDLKRKPGRARSLLQSYMEKLLPFRLGGLERKLDYLGYSAVLSPHEFLLLSVIIGLALASAVLAVLEYTRPWAFVLAFICFAILPLWWLAEKKRDKDEALLRELPHALDILATCTRAGLSFDAALARLMENLDAAGLKSELEMLVLDLRMGQGRTKALRAFAHRIDLPAVRSFTMAIIQGEKMGTAIGDLLEDQAESVRQAEFQRLEKLAQEAPVKLLFPLIIFIFPVVFIVLFVPLGMQLLALFGGG